MFSLSSSDIVQLTLWVLIAFSLITWALILYKTWVIYAINRSGKRYSQQFWVAKDLETAAKLDQESTSMGRIAGAGFKALQNLNNYTSPMLKSISDIQPIFERSLRQQINKERKRLEQGLSLLASVGSTAPFVGLFGTVWGIMHALQSISHAKSASLDVVAGPIGEALIATAIGIAVAIPAVLAYNFFLRRIKLAEAELEYFATDMLNLMVMTSDFKSNKE
ncbi:MAG: MotA/TolQ/ExbB proton channel family protein [Methyloglobulus sp.]|nr:MotA/TolQ/ExbB proton channel family protein [Methyloglobulus sp.]